MSNNFQGNMPFGMMPFIMPMQPQPSICPHVHPPTRVQVAMEVLHHFTSKTMQRVAINDTQIHPIEGQSLTKAELNLHNSACNAINDFLVGKMIPDFYEGHALREEMGSSVPGGVRGMYMRCWNCNVPGSGGPRQECLICNGHGTLLVFPTDTPSMDQQSDGWARGAQDEEVEE